MHRRRKKNSKWAPRDGSGLSHFMLLISRLLSTSIAFLALPSFPGPPCLSGTRLAKTCAGKGHCRLAHAQLTSLEHRSSCSWVPEVAGCPPPHTASLAAAPSICHAHRHQQPAAAATLQQGGRSTQAHGPRPAYSFSRGSGSMAAGAAWRFQLTPPAAASAARQGKIASLSG